MHQRRRLRALGLLPLLVACSEVADLAVTNVHVVDMETGTVSAVSTILVRDNRITAITASDAVGAHEVVDGEGGFVIPGLWDMHVHLRFAGAEALPLFVGNGVTGVRDMGGALTSIDSIVRDARDRDWPTPRVLRAGRWVDGQKELTDRYILSTPEEGRTAVAELAAAGVDHIKIHNGLPRDVFFAVADEARLQGLPLVGHVPMEVHPAEAIEAGLRTVEHIATIYEGTLSRDVETVADQLDLVSSYPSTGADTLARWFVDHDAWFTPTMVAYAVGARLAELEQRPDSRRQYVTSELVAWWDEAFPIEPHELDPRLIAIRQRGDTAFAALVSVFDTAGVPMLAATDLGGREIYPGFSLHDELVLMVERAHLTPLEALRTATINPADYLEARDSLGTIAPGMLADMIVVERNPLENIRNVRRIRGVVADGRYYVPENVVVPVRDGDR